DERLVPRVPAAHRASNRQPERDPRRPLPHPRRDRGPGVARAAVTAGDRRMAEIERHDTPIERNDIQGLLASGYGHLPCARYLLVRFPDDPAAARRWLGGLASEVTTAAKKAEVCSINVALTLARELERRRREIAEWRAFEVKELRAERQPDNHEHFGFADGLSQPEIEGLATSTSANGAGRLKTGEFILGFADESGFRADGP